MLARGTFHLNAASLKTTKNDAARRVRDTGASGSGFCILDSTLAVAGEIPVSKLRSMNGNPARIRLAQPLLARAPAVNPQSQFWGVSTGAGNFLADHPPGPNSGLDFSKIFRGLEDTWFQADLSAGSASRSARHRPPKRTP